MNDRLAPLRADPEGSALLCDIDGTLAPISPEPGDAAVPERTRATLAELAERYGLVACVSGRRAPEAREMVGVASLLYIGNHGFELLGPGDDEAWFDPALSGQVDRVRDFIAALDRSRLEALGLRLEDKGPIQSLHWRGAPSEAEAEREVSELAAAAGEQGLEPRWGRKVLELRPRVAVDKGTATRRVVAERRLAGALFGGDDVTDLDAFRALRTMRSDGSLDHAVCVGVTSDEEPADLRALSDVTVAGTEGFAELLAELRPAS